MTPTEQQMVKAIEKKMEDVAKRIKFNEKTGDYRGHNDLLWQQQQLSFQRRFILDGRSTKSLPR